MRLITRLMKLTVTINKNTPGKPEVFLFVGGITSYVGGMNHRYRGCRYLNHAEDDLPVGEQD